MMMLVEVVQGGGAQAVETCTLTTAHMHLTSACAWFLSNHFLQYPPTAHELPNELLSASDTMS